MECPARRARAARAAGLCSKALDQRADEREGDHDREHDERRHPGGLAKFFGFQGGEGFPSTRGDLVEPPLAELGSFVDGLALAYAVISPATDAIAFAPLCVVTARVAAALTFRISDSQQGAH